MTDISIKQRIYEAIISSDCERLAELLRIYPKLVNDHGNATASWLKTAADFGSVPVIELLISAGSDVEAGADRCEGTPLVSAVAGGHLSAAEHLIAKGANVGYPRLLIAAINAERNTLELVKLLVQHGADMNKCYHFGGEDGPVFNAVSYAKTVGKNEVYDFLTSQGGSEPAIEYRPRPPSSLDEEVIAYFNEHIGPVYPLSLMEIIPSTPWVAVHLIKPGPGHDHLTLFTTGMSSEEMVIPELSEPFLSHRFGEIYIQLPADWPSSQEALLRDPNCNWVVHWLQLLGKIPYQEQTWYAPPATIVANGDPPAPLASGVKFTSFLLVDTQNFRTQDGKILRLYQAHPIYTEERNFELAHGLEALLKRFRESKVPGILDVNRASAV